MEASRWCTCPNNKIRGRERDVRDDDAVRGVRASRKHICSRCRRQELITSPPFIAVTMQLRAAQPVQQEIAHYHRRCDFSREFAILIGREGEWARGGGGRGELRDVTVCIIPWDLNIANIPPPGMSRHFISWNAQRDREGGRKKNTLARMRQEGLRISGGNLFELEAHRSNRRSPRRRDAPN